MISLHTNNSQMLVNSFSWKSRCTLAWGVKISEEERCYSIQSPISILKVLNFWKSTSYFSLKPLWSGMGEVVPARTLPTLHPPSPPTVHQLSWLALLMATTQQMDGFINLKTLLCCYCIKFLRYFQHFVRTLFHKDYSLEFHAVSIPFSFVVWASSTEKYLSMWWFACHS